MISCDWVSLPLLIGNDNADFGVAIDSNQTF